MQKPTETEPIVYSKGRQISWYMMKGLAFASIAAILYNVFLFRGL
jgi:hypothetical protein